MKTFFFAAVILMTALFSSYSEITLSDTPQVVLENYQSTPASSSLIVGRNSTFSDIQWATGFKTGNERSVFYSALFLYNGAWPGTTGGFKFSLYSDSSGLPGELTAELDGPDRPVNGVTWYTATERLELEINTTYWLVASAAPQTESPRFFEWRGTSSGDEVSNLAGWELLNSGALRTDQGAWSSNSSLGHTAIQVQAVPEPASALMIALGCLLVTAYRRFFRYH
jgi:hypothetical protein